VVETTPSPVTPNLLSDEERAFDASIRTYAAIPEPVMEKDNPDALFANGWGRRGHFALFVAPSGYGKSVISTQALVPWALGKPALFGSDPLVPLRVAVIQAEDDDTEMGEFRRDHRLGHQEEGFTMEQILEAEKHVYDWSPFFRGKVGDAFLRGLDLAFRRQATDVVILNPLQSYTDIDLTKNKEITEFLRNGIDPLLAKFHVFMLCVHHTNKPQIDKSKGGAFGDDAMAAYVGAGGAELTNYARSVTFMRRCTPKECPIENSFFLIGAKRGNRLGWKDADGKKTNKKIIAYSEDYIHWRVPTPDEIAAASLSGSESVSGSRGVTPCANPDGRAASPDGRAALDLSPSEAASLIADLIRADWPAKVWRHCHDKLRSKLPTALFNEAWEYFSRNYKSYGFKMISEGRSYHFEPDPDFTPGNDGQTASIDGQAVLGQSPEEPYWNR
jgi:hypothetical protein